MKAHIVYVDKTAHTHTRMDVHTIAGAKALAKDFVARMATSHIDVSMEVVDKNTIFLEWSY